MEGFSCFYSGSLQMTFRKRDLNTLELTQECQTVAITMTKQNLFQAKITKKLEILKKVGKVASLPGGHIYYLSNF